MTETRRPAGLAPRATSQLATPAAAKPLPKQALSQAAKVSPAKVSPEPERVCATPQAATPDSTPAVATETLQAVPATETNATATAPPAVDTALPGNSAAADGRNLTEAVPNYRSNPLPKYPTLARQKQWLGVVWLLVDVSADGLVNDLSIEQSCGHSVLDRAASQTVRRWSFTPAMRAGLPMASRVRIPVRFRLEDG